MHSPLVRKHFSFKQTALLGIAGVCFVTAGLLNQKFAKPIIVLDKQDTALNLDQNIVHLFHLGNKRFLADLLWIQTLLESDTDHYKARDLNSWMYLRFLNISILDPKFYENYMYGGLYLSIVKDDLIGATKIFERGLVYYPDDYKLNYYNGFNYYFEQGNFAKAIPFLEKIQNHPKAPTFLKLIVNKMKFEMTDNNEAALAFMEHELSTTQDPVLKKKLKFDIYSLKAEYDLKCLNEAGTNCNTRDAEGIPYYQEKGIWRSAKTFNPFKIFRKQK